MRVRVKSPVGRDGKTYQPGEILEVSIEEARALARSGSVVELDETEAERDEQAEPNS